jgi:hypothetical protein
MKRHEKRKAQKQRSGKVPQLFIEPVSAKNSETGKEELYLVLDGRRAAYRGHPGTPQAGTWVSLDPDFIIHNEEWPDDGTPVFEAGEVGLMPEPKGPKQ